MQKEEFKYWVWALDGYLQAVSHLNDDRNKRHGFFASDLDVSNTGIEEAVKSHLKCEDIAIEKLENYSEAIRAFSTMVKSNIFQNFLLGEKLADPKKENFIREQLSWHIEDYITMLETSLKQQPDSWIVKHPLGKKIESMLFKFKENVLIVGFGHGNWYET